MGAKNRAPAPNSQVSTFISVPSACGTDLGAAEELVDGVVVQGDFGGGDFGVVQVEGGAFGADPGDGGEVVPWGWAGGGPVQGGAVAPGVVGLDQRGVLPGVPDVVEERQGGGAQEECSAGGELVGPGEAFAGQVVGVAAGHPDHPEPVLDEEGGVEADEQHPEVDLAQAFVEHPAGELGPPEVEAAEHRE